MEAEFDQVEASIESLLERIAGCRRAVMLARGAIWLSAIALGLVILLPAYRTPSLVLGTIATMIGGTVWSGASASSRTQAEAELVDAEARRNALLDAVVDRNGWRQSSRALH